MQIIEPLAMTDLAWDAGIYFGTTAVFFGTIALLLVALATVVLAGNRSVQASA